MIVVTQFDLQDSHLTKQELEKKLAAHRIELRKMGVVSLAVFGSVARNESTQQSDIDLLVDFDRDVGLFHLFEIQHRLEEIIGVPKIDLIQKGALHPALRERILSETVNVA
jgi:predicted nucleotidyltransferase